MAETTNTELTRDEVQMLDFVTLYGTDGLFFICVQPSGEGAKIDPETLVSALTTSIKPSISSNGYWFIGSTDTGVLAKAQTPELKRDGSIISWKYDHEEDASWRILADLAEYVFKFDDLTPEQRDAISLHFSQLTDEEIAQLQQPARDMITVLKETNDNVTTEEGKRAAAEALRERAEAIRKQQEEARQTNTATAIADTEAATATALEVADNPTYIGTDMYVYEYDLLTHSYNKTQKMININIKIDQTFGSVAELQANQPTGQMDGQFALISSDTEDEDNAKLYTSKNGKWVYLADLSGFRGFRGYTPQFSIGKVTIGDNRSDAAVSLSADGNDEAGNPKFLVNFRIPSFAFSDFTQEQIALLQKPATDKAAEVQAAENERVKAELARKEAEEQRAQEHTAKMTKAAEATSKANTAAANANGKASVAQTAADNANSATEASKRQTDLAKELNDHPQKQGENGNWWKWNTETNQYEDTGFIARGGAMYPTFSHDGNKLYMEDYGSNIAERVSIEGNSLMLNF